MIPALQSVQGNPINLKINKEMRIFIVYIWWVSEHPVIVGGVGGGVWSTATYEILVLPYCSVSFFLEGLALAVPPSHHSPHDSSPLLLVSWQGWGWAVEWGHS